MEVRSANVITERKREDWEIGREWASRECVVIEAA